MKEGVSKVRSDRHFYPKCPNRNVDCERVVGRTFVRAGAPPVAHRFVQLSTERNSLCHTSQLERKRKGHRHLL